MNRNSVELLKGDDMPTASPSRADSPQVQPVPPLQSGDRMTREEFERRYEAMPDLKKAELIKGVVYVPSPVNHRKHGNPHFNMISWLGTYAAVTPGVEGGDNSSLRLDMSNEPQADACLLILPEYGGQVRFDADGHILGGPELAGEVAASSASYDLHDKLQCYERNGVREYVVWRVFDEEIDWFVWREGGFERLAVAADGIYRSEVFPGLWLDPTDLITGNMSAIVQAAPLILARPEHTAFVARLAQAAASRKDFQ